VPPILCEYCESSDHDVHNFAYRDVDATCVRVEESINEMPDKMIETMKERIVEFSHCVNRSREDYNVYKSHSSLGCPKLEASPYDDFEPSHLARPDLHGDMPVPSLERMDGLPMSPSLGLAHEPNT